MEPHVCRFCGQEVDLAEATDSTAVAYLLLAHLKLVCPDAPGPMELGLLAEAQASAEMAGAAPTHWANAAAQHFDNWDLISMGGVLLNTHHERMCRPPCCIHSPSEHHMRSWEQVWSQRVRAVFRRCPHGEHHPDPDDLQAHGGRLLHRCDGCCLPPQDEGRLLGART